MKGPPKAFRDSLECVDSDENSPVQERRSEYLFSSDLGNADLTKRIRGEASRLYQSRSKSFLEIWKTTEKNSTDVPLLIEHLVGQYMSEHKDHDYSPALVHLAGPLFSVFSTDREIDVAFHKIMALLSMSELKAQFSKTNIDHCNETRRPAHAR